LCRQAEQVLGQYTAARESLLKTKQAAEAQEKRALQWQILATQSELEQASGDETATDRLRDQAQEVIDNIDAHASAPREVSIGQPTAYYLTFRMGSPGQA